MKTPMNVQEVAAYTGYSPNTIYNFVFYKKIPFERISRKKVVFYREEIDIWLLERENNKKGEIAERSQEVPERCSDPEIPDKNEPARKARPFLAVPFRTAALYSSLVVVAFLAGLMINRSFRPGKRGEIPAIGAARPKESGVMNMITPEKISGIQIGPRSSPEDNRIKVRLDSISNVELKGEATSEVILPILEYTLKAKDDDYANKATALDVVQPYVANESITSTLIYVLMNDGNPAIRMKTLSILEKEIRRNVVKETILACIKKDANEAVRFRALEVLEKAMDQEVVDVLNGIRERDKSELLRKRADVLCNKYAKKM